MTKLKLYNLISEQDNQIIAYHGTRTTLPFQHFDNSMIGTGLVSTGNKYDGFFFTTEKENAEYYSEYFICKVIINDVKANPLDITHPRTVLTSALKNKQNYVINDVLDGHIFSDIVVVPKNNLDTIKIVEWEFIGDEDYLFKNWDDTFGDEDGFVNSDMIDDILDIVNIDLNFLLKIPIFEKYYMLKYR